MLWGGDAINQGCGSGSGFELLDPDPHTNANPDLGGQKLSTKIEKSIDFHVLKCWMFSFEG
jgi:hypothetical protein